MSSDRRRGGFSSSANREIIRQAHGTIAGQDNRPIEGSGPTKLVRPEGEFLEGVSGSRRNGGHRRGP